jgi:hypothetical protein
VNWSPTSCERAEFAVLVVEIGVVMKTFRRRERLGGIYFVAWGTRVFRRAPQVDNAELVAVRSGSVVSLTSEEVRGMTHQKWHPIQLWQDICHS